MAEIRIEEKKRSLAWLWILLLLLVVAAVTWFVTTGRTVADTTVMPQADSVVAPSAAPVPPTRIDSVEMPVAPIANRMRLLNA